ncbi:hypothetical protein [Parabacteroides pacaensis]|uniref:hypothetical protein n=1 Tax=Parabacteroides pacaensis TaxID=2086575 RepID=UPI000D1046F3|nr:hypothetical protein [Parabacteroides pacaensis]
MEKIIEIKEGFTITEMFDRMKVGDLFKIPYDKSRHSGIKSEAARRNRDARLTKELKSKMDLKFRVSEIEHPGYTSVIRIK